MQAQWAAEGLEGSVSVAMEETAAVEVVEEESRALVVLTSPQAPVAVNILARRGGAVAGGGHSGTVAIQHRGGNKQVVLSNGQRWHLPRGKSLNDIPAWDPLGDELQAAVKEEAAKWSEATLFALHGRRMASTFFRMIFF